MKPATEAGYFFSVELPVTALAQEADTSTVVSTAVELSSTAVTETVTTVSTAVTTAQPLQRECFYRRSNNKSRVVRALRNLSLTDRQTQGSRELIQELNGQRLSRLGGFSLIVVQAGSQ